MWLGVSAYTDESKFQGVWNLYGQSVNVKLRKTILSGNCAFSLSIQQLFLASGVNYIIGIIVGFYYTNV